MTEVHGQCIGPARMELCIAQRPIFGGQCSSTGPQRQRPARASSDAMFTVRSAKRKACQTLPQVRARICSSCPSLRWQVGVKPSGHTGQHSAEGARSCALTPALAAQMTKRQTAALEAAVLSRTERGARRCPGGRWEDRALDRRKVRESDSPVTRPFHSICLWSVPVAIGLEYLASADPSR